jgi:hypothetical protein
VAALKTVISWLSYLFHSLLALCLLGLASIALISGNQTLHLEMLPWSSPSLDYILLGGAVLGFVSVLLAITGRLKFLFFVWSLVVAALLLKGYIFSSYRFAAGELRTTIYLILASWVAILGAWFQMRRQVVSAGPRKYRLK